MDKLKKHEATSSTTSSFDFPDSAKFPKTKAAALEYLELDSEISLSRDMMNSMVMYFRDIGAEKQLPSEKEKLYEYLNHFHEQLAVQNPYWPEGLPFGYVYGAFFNRIIQGYIKIGGFNIRSHSLALRKWAESGNIDKLRDAFYEKDEAETKQIESQTRRELSDREKKVIADGYVDFSPDVVESQITKIERIWGDMEKALEAFPGTKNYVKRLYNTREKFESEQE